RPRTSRRGDRLSDLPRRGVRRNGDDDARYGAGETRRVLSGAGKAGVVASRRPSSRTGGPGAGARGLRPAPPSRRQRSGGPGAGMTERPVIPSLKIPNGEAARLQEVPALSIADFREGITSGIARGARLAALFGQPLENDQVRLIAVLAHSDEG